MVRGAVRQMVAMALLVAALLTSTPSTPTAAAGAAETTTVRLDGLTDRIATGASHVCAILDTGGVTCWGNGSYGQLGYGNTNTIGDNDTPAVNPANGGIVPLPGGRTAIAIAAGESHTCALLADGTITCWGDNLFGQLGYGNTNNIGDGPGETPATNPVNGGIIPLPGGQTATAITAGTSHTCALLADGTVTCWGYGALGELGYGNTARIGDNETPADNPVGGGIVALPGGQTATAISSGSGRTCALLADGTITCWGQGSFGQLGYGNTNSIGDDLGETPATNPVNGGIVPLPGGQAAMAISSGYAHTCAVLADGTITCWGYGADGRLGYGNTDNIGDDPGETPATNPVNGGIVPLPGGQTADAITSGAGHNCALLANGTLTCWGLSNFGQLGYGTTDNIGDDPGETPATNPVNGGIVPLPGAQTADAIASGAGQTCAVLAGGPITCWGRGDDGRLGYGNTNTIGDDETPAANPVNGGIVQLPGTRTSVSIATGEMHACAVLGNGTVNCWGYGASGRLGYGNPQTIGNDATPADNPVNGGIIPLPGGQTATAVAAGTSHTCALLANGTVTCWGNGGQGRLGYGNTNDIGDDETPADNPVNGGIIALPGGQTASAISAGGAQTCALLADGTITCWGDNSSGQLGYGNTNAIGNDETPAQNPVNGGIIALPGSLKAAAITVGSDHACALLADGTVTCWGYGSLGRLGHNSTESIGDDETPAENPDNGGIVELPGGQTAIAVTAGANHTCALLADSSITCWGYAGSGQLGYANTNNIGDDETPATNPTNGGIVALPGGQTAIAVSAGSFFTCALLADGTITCWGYGFYGQLGYGNLNSIGDDETPATNPVNGGIVELPGGLDATAIDTGNGYSCALLADGRISCWGATSFGQTGYGNVNTIGDDETPAANPVNGGIVPLANHLSAIDYRALTPARLLDTRASGSTIDDLFEAGDIRTAGSTLHLDVAGRGGIPSDATAITLSVAAVTPTASGFLTIWPCSAGQPNASSLNYSAGVNTANTVITGITGDVCIFTSKDTHLIADVVGFTPRSSTLTPLTPTRYLDTRASGATFDDQFEADGPRTAGSTLTLDIADRGLVPAGTSTVILNVAAVAPAGGGFLTIWPCNAAQPNASNLNYASGVTTANLVITRAAADGTVCIYTSQATHLIADVVGYSANSTAPGPSLMRTVNPGRLVDTRAAGATTDNRYEKTGLLVANATNTYQITNRYPVTNANVAVLNVTVVAPSSSGFLTIWPCDQAKPNASSLNFITGVNRAVQVLTKLAPNGTVCIASSKATHLIVDVNGTTM